MSRRLLNRVLIFPLSGRYLALTPPSGLAGKESTCNAGDLGLIPGLGRSPGEGNGYLPQYSHLENSMDCIVHGAEKSWHLKMLLKATHMHSNKKIKQDKKNIVQIEFPSHLWPLISQIPLHCIAFQRSASHLQIYTFVLLFIYFLFIFNCGNMDTIQNLSS